MSWCTATQVSTRSRLTYVQGQTHVCTDLYLDLYSIVLHCWWRQGGDSHSTVCAQVFWNAHEHHQSQIGNASWAGEVNSSASEMSHLVLDLTGRLTDCVVFRVVTRAHRAHTATPAHTTQVEPTC